MCKELQAQFMSINTLLRSLKTKKGKIQRANTQIAKANGVFSAGITFLKAAEVKALPSLTFVLV